MHISHHQRRGSKGLIAFVVLLALACSSAVNASDTTQVNTAIAQADTTAATTPEDTTPADTTQEETAPDETTDTVPDDTTGPAVEGLGEPNPATDTPVSVGFLSAGQTAAFDNSQELVVAQAAADYANDYLGGIGGHEINLVTCETKNTPEGAADCLNQFFQADVVAVMLPELSEEAQVATALLEAKIPMISASGGTPQVLTAPDGAYSLTGSAIALAGAVGAHLLDEGHDRVAAVVIDVPSATAAFQGLVVPAFEAAGITVDLVPVAPGTADMSPDLAAAEQNDPDAYWVFGNDPFCIAGTLGLETLGIDKPLYYIPECISPAFLDAVDPSGAFVSTLYDLTPDNPELLLYEAVVAEYGPDITDRVETLASAYLTVIATARMLQDTSGELTPETVNAAIRSAGELPAPLGGGNTFHCDGTAGPAPFTGLCSKYAFLTQLDAEGNGTGYIAVDTSLIFG